MPSLSFPPLFAEGLSMKPDVDFTIPFLGFEVTSSMLVSVVAAALIIAMVQVVMRAPKLIPSGAQNFVEWIVELLSDLLEKILGHELMLKGFWYFATVFIFIVGCNILSLTPGVGSIGSGHGANFWNIEVEHPFLRGANADVNMTSAMSAIFFVVSIYWAFTVLGPVKFFGHVFGSKVKFSHPFANIAFVLIFIGVGLIEMFSILFIRPLAFTFRLYGNIYGGEYLLDSIYKLAGSLGLSHFAFLFLTPFYFYELLVAFIQAFVFCALTAVFTRLMCVSDHEEGHAEEVTAH